MYKIFLHFLTQVIVLQFNIHMHGSYSILNLLSFTILVQDFYQIFITIDLAHWKNENWRCRVRWVEKNEILILNLAGCEIVVVCYSDLPKKNW